MKTIKGTVMVSNKIIFKSVKITLFMAILWHGSAQCQVAETKIAETPTTSTPDLQPVMPAPISEPVTEAPTAPTAAQQPAEAPAPPMPVPSQPSGEVSTASVEGPATPTEVSPAPTPAEVPAMPPAPSEVKPAEPEQIKTEQPEQIKPLIPIKKARVAEVPNLEQKNKEADKAYLAWRLHAPGSKISQDVKKLMTKEVIDYILNASQLPVDAPIAQRQIQDKIQQVVERTTNRFKWKLSAQQQRQLRSLVESLIAPEYLYQVEIDSPNPLEKLYRIFLETLEEMITPVGTTLREWALRFLTSESQLIALQTIEKVKLNDQDFNNLTVLEKKRALERSLTLIHQRFLNNMKGLQNKFKFTLPPRFEQALRYKIDRFLNAKFITF